MRQDTNIIGQLFSSLKLKNILFYQIIPHTDTQTTYTSDETLN